MNKRKITFKVSFNDVNLTYKTIDSLRQRLAYVAGFKNVEYLGNIENYAHGLIKSEWATRTYIHMTKA